MPTELQSRPIVGLPTLAEAIVRPFSTLSEFIRIHAGLRPDHVAVIQGERQVRWGDFDALIDRTAATLQGRGVSHQEVVAICAANSIEYLVTFLGALRVGVAVAPLAPNANVDSLDLMVRDSGAKILFLDTAVSDVLSSLPNTAPNLRRRRVEQTAVPSEVIGRFVEIVDGYLIGTGRATTKRVRLDGISTQAT